MNDRNIIHLVDLVDPLPHWLCLDDENQILRVNRVGRIEIVGIL